MKAPRQRLRVLALLLLAVAAAGAGWLVRTTIDSEPPAAAAASVLPGYVSEAEGLPQLLCPVSTAEADGWLGPLAGGWDCLASPEAHELIHEWPDSALEPGSLFTEPADADGDVRDLLNDLQFWLPSPGNGGVEPPPAEPQDPTLAGLPEWGRNPHVEVRWHAEFSRTSFSNSGMTQAPAFPRRCGLVGESFAGGEPSQEGG
jgi:hypothetical protein